MSKFSSILILTLYLFKQSILENATEEQVISFSQEAKNDEATEEYSGESGNPLFDEFWKEWAEKLPDYVSQYVYMVPIEYKESVIFYENVTKFPVSMKGGIILEETTVASEKIDFTIEAPNKTVIFKSTKFADIFNLNCTVPGLYKITIANNYLNREAKPTLVINTGQNLILEKENLSETEKKMDKLITFLKKYDQDTKITRYSRAKRKSDLRKTNKYFFSFSFIETIVLIGVTVWQYYYLKHLFEVKGSL